MVHGTERHILSIVKYMDRYEFENFVCVPEDGIMCRELEKSGVKYFIAGRKHGYKSKVDGMFGKGAKALQKLIRQEKFDIVHTHLNSFGGMIAKLEKTPVIIHTRHGVFWSEDELKKISFAERYFQKFKSDIFDITVAIGEYEKQVLINKFRYDEKKVRTTINGVDVDEINLKVDKLKTKQELFGTDDLIVGTTVRLERQKGLNFFIDAVNLIRDKTAGIKFAVIGNGSQREELIQKRNSLGLEDKILFLDYKKNVLDYVYNFDIMIMTSLWEGLSYSVQEAMALSKPVIALTSGNVSGLKEIVLNAQTGYLIESNYVSELAKYIIVLSKDINKRLRFGRAGQQRERDFFPESRTASDMETVYSELIEKKISSKKN